MAGRSAYVERYLRAACRTGATLGRTLHFWFSVGVLPSSPLILSLESLITQP